mmetsp:Transcript_20108/g.23173  ORF Transcript_20108/g.23173 Transcript_20108/m.23173 type:complete len:241 (+) Transcript_20108:396-1118(+)
MQLKGFLHPSFPPHTELLLSRHSPRTLDGSALGADEAPKARTFVAFLHYHNTLRTLQLQTHSMSRLTSVSPCDARTTAPSGAGATRRTPPGTHTAHCASHPLCIDVRRMPCELGSREGASVRGRTKAAPSLDVPPRTPLPTYPKAEWLASAKCALSAPQAASRLSTTESRLGSRRASSNSPAASKGNDTTRTISEYCYPSPRKCAGPSWLHWRDSGRRQVDAAGGQKGQHGQVVRLQWHR